MILRRKLLLFPWKCIVQTERKQCMHPLSYAIIKENGQCKKFYSTQAKKLKVFIPEDEDEAVVPMTVRLSQDKRVIFSSVVEKNTVKFSYGKTSSLTKEWKEEELKRQRSKALPLIVEQYLTKEGKDEISTSKHSSVSEDYDFPYAKFDEVKFTSTNRETSLVHSESQIDRKVLDKTSEEIALRLAAYNEGTLPEFIDLDENEESIHGENHGSILEDKGFHGTSDPSVPPSKVPCGGCGAFLHCQDPGLPGYVPSQLFKGKDKGELRSTKCQRCFFLVHHKMALSVRVAPDLYPKLLQPIQEKYALVLLIVDVMDMPCSLWEGIFDIIGYRRPIILVGNKIDLLPPDCPDHLRSAQKSLLASVKQSSLSKANLKHVALVSAKTGYGIENLITRIQKSWEGKGDIYIVGCTNSGKSSLFNALLGSDLCKSSASDLIVRATTSVWPGTTLDMLKFPILRPSGHQLYLRLLRLKEQQKKKAMEVASITARHTNKAHQATLSGHIGRTFKKTEEPVEVGDFFSMNAKVIGKDKAPIRGINDQAREYILSKWCYDTPGTVHPDQLITLLTHDELLRVIPRQMLQPRTFSLKPGHSVFIAGMSRLDYLYGPKPIKATVFCSHDLPITVTKASEASKLYYDYLGTEAFGVPFGSCERMVHWPALKSEDIRLYGTQREQSCADVVLSSSGWIAVTGSEGAVIELRAWTPGGRGIYVRDPPMLPRAVSLRGKRISKSPAYRRHRYYLTKL